MNNLGILDEEFIKLRNEILMYGLAINSKIADYESCVNYILNESIKDQAISSKIKSLVTKVNELKSPLAEILLEVNTITNTFIFDVNNEDKFIYREE